MEVVAGEQRVVVEHLLEVRHGPRGVDRVAREAAADLVVDPAGCHIPQRLQRHLPLPVPEQEAQHAGRRELRRAAEAALDRVVLAAKLSDRLVQEAGRHLRVARLQQRGAGEPLGDRTALLDDLPAARRPRLRDGLEHLRPGGHARARRGREVRARVERHLLGRAEDVQRPAAVAGHGLHRVHVDRVDVRSLLAVDLDAHEVLVHEPGDLRVLEGLALHDVAPVAGRVADRHEQRLVLLAGAAQRGVAPRHPVDGVVLVLAEVGGGLRRERVRHHSDATHRRAGGTRAARPRRRARGRRPPLARSRSAGRPGAR